MSRAAPELFDPARSLWVSAHAGAGKTRVLIDRVARLLVAGTAPEQILCLTFTKAAAAEMAARLSERLGALALADDRALTDYLGELHVEAPDAALLIRTRRLFARALETPGGLKIQTIHAFCERLLGRFPIEAGIAPGFAVLDERTASELLGQARAQILSELRGAEEQAALAVLARLGDADALQSMVNALIGCVRDLAGHGHEVDLENSGKDIAAVLGLGEEETPDQTEQEFLRRLPLDALRSAVSEMAQGAKTDQKHAALIAAVIAAPAASLEEYCGVFLTDKGEPRKTLCTKPIADRRPAIAEALAREQERMLGFIERRKAAIAALRARAALLVGARIIRRYNSLKQRRAALDYDDLIAKSVALFSRSSAAWVLYKLDRGLDHILVDEAQDTNPLQWRVITALADEFFAGTGARQGSRSIFAVGDEKQSIYRFQGADPAIFGRMEEYFDQKLLNAGARLHTPPLHFSWRSAAPILQFVDTVFEVPSLATKLSSGLTPMKHRVVRKEQAGLVELWPTEKAERADAPVAWNVPLDYVSPESPRARLAHKIADKIKAWLDSGERLPSQNRAIRPGDIMILVRRRDAFVEEVIRALKARKIPVAGSDRLALTGHIAVLDLMALARFTLLPEDDLTLACVLKSPVFGFDDEALFALARDRAGSLWRALAASDDASCRAAHERLSSFLVLAAHHSPAEFFASLLGPGGVRAALVGRLGADAEDPIDELLRASYDYERLNPPSLQGFLHWLEAGTADVKRDMDQGRDEVRLMTVHGAKGLEAPIVILPDTCALPHLKSQPGFFALENPKTKRMIPLWSQRKADDPAPLRAARQAGADAAEAEHLRLFYVALTRARDRLYICGHETKPRDPRAWHALAEAAMEKIGTKIVSGDGEVLFRLERAQTGAPDGRPDRGEAVTPSGALPDWIGRMPRPEPPARRTVSPSALSEAGAPEPPVFSPRQAEAADRLRFQRGRLIHRLLEMLPALPPGGREAAAFRFLGQSRHGLAPEAQNEIAASVLRVLNDARFAPLFAPGSRAEVQVAGPVTLGRDSVPVFGVIDRLAVAPDSVLIVDYKTNRPPPRDPAQIPRAYLRQMAAYRALLAQIYPGRVIGCALLWTETPLLMGLGPEALDAALAAVRPPSP